MLRPEEGAENKKSKLKMDTIKHMLRSRAAAVDDRTQWELKPQPSNSILLCSDLI